jgi:hypothetical protein
MTLECKKCGGRQTKVVPADKMTDFIDKKSTVGNIGTSGTITLSSEAIYAIIMAAIEVVKKFFDWQNKKEQNKRNVVVCLDCGHWEKI